MSKTIGSYASKTGGIPAAIQPPPKPPSDGALTKQRSNLTAPPVSQKASLSDNPAWGKQRDGDESPQKPDPAWGYTGHEHARRWDKGEENLSMASRINRRRQQNIERRFSASPYASEIAKDVLAAGDGVEYTGPKIYGWASFPPQGLSEGNTPFSASGAFALAKEDPRMAMMAHSMS